jgi:hypothetical protein
MWSHLAVEISKGSIVTITVPWNTIAFVGSDVRLRALIGDVLSPTHRPHN